MEQEQYTREQTIIIILLCILLHLLFIGIFFFWQHSDNRQEINLSAQYEKRIEQLLEKQTKEPLTPQEEKEIFEWVNGQEKGNASVIFENEPEDEQGQPDGIEKGFTIEKPTEESTVDTATEPSPEEIEKEQEVQKPEPTPPIIEETLEDAATTMASSIESAPKIIEKKPVKSSASIKKEQKKSEEKQSVTLADITKGLVQKMHHSSDHLVNAINGKTGKVTEEQLRYERYFKKISYHFSNSDRIHRSNHIDALMKARDQIRDSMNIHIALNRDGSILDVRLASSCGSKVIDDYYMFVFKDASSSFPTVPNFLPAPLRFGYTIGVQQHAQQSSSPIRFTMS